MKILYFIIFADLARFENLNNWLIFTGTPKPEALPGSCQFICYSIGYLPFVLPQIN
jgi:hypothetical protein